MSVGLRSHLVVWLQKWLQIEDLKELGRVEIEIHNQSVARIDFELSDSD